MIFEFFAEKKYDVALFYINQLFILTLFITKIRIIIPCIYDK